MNDKPTEQEIVILFRQQEKELSAMKFKLAATTKSWKDMKQTVLEQQIIIQTYTRKFNLISEGLDALRSELDTMEESE